MGCDIHTVAEVFDGIRWEEAPKVFPLDEFERDWQKATHSSSPWRDRNYSLFGWLADVRNYSDVDPIAAGRGIPGDSTFADYENEEFYLGDHSFSWVSLAELLAVDYDKEIEDRRTTVRRSNGFIDGGATAPKGQGKKESLREFLGEAYFEDLEILKTLGPPDKVRVVFGFDS